MHARRLQRSVCIEFLMQTSSSRNLQYISTCYLSKGIPQNLTSSMRRWGYFGLPVEEPKSRNDNRLTGKAFFSTRAADLYQLAPTEHVCMSYRHLLVGFRQENQDRNNTFAMLSRQALLRSERSRASVVLSHHEKEYLRPASWRYSECQAIHS